MKDIHWKEEKKFVKHTSNILEPMHSVFSSSWPSSPTTHSTSSKATEEASKGATTSTSKEVTKEVLSPKGWASVSAFLQHQRKMVSDK